MAALAGSRKQESQPSGWEGWLGVWSKSGRDREGLSVGQQMPQLFQGPGVVFRRVLLR